MKAIKVSFLIKYAYLLGLLVTRVGYWIEGNPAETTILKNPSPLPHVHILYFQILRNTKINMHRIVAAGNINKCGS